MAGQSRKPALARRGLHGDYAPLLESLKRRVREAQTNSILLANRELTLLYWDIGRLIVERQEAQGWGKGVVDRLATDMQRAFPGIRGFSSPNIWKMRAFFMAYRPAVPILSQPVIDLVPTNSAQPAPKLKGKPNRSKPNSPRRAFDDRTAHDHRSGRVHSQGRTHARGRARAMPRPHRSI